MRKFHQLLITILAFTLIMLTPTCFANKPKLLFVQTAQSGTVTKMSNYPNKYKLQLNNVTGYVTYFSDRPNRITGLMTTNDFVTYWNKGASSFAKDNPNAGLESVTINSLKKTKNVSFVFEISNPIYNHKNRTITYTAKPLNKNIRITKPIKLGYTSIFIDDVSGMIIGACENCGEW
ncbi:MAG: hypothetical protein KAS93_00310 [Gammaproteobacteria bacterium]|nr:hypothetical protein [Gammaproteobacteria bacterium]